MHNLELKITGESALIMHSDKLSDPLHPMTKEHKKLTSKRKKTDDDHIAIARSEWASSMYFDENLGPYLPTVNVKAALVEGAKLSKLGAAINRGTWFMSEREKIKYNGPKTLDEMWETGRFTDARSVVVQRSRLIRYRPIFAEWSLTVPISFDPYIIERDQIASAMTEAGKYIGLGDYRPNKGGPFGRFSVQVL